MPCAASNTALDDLRNLGAARSTRLSGAALTSFQHSVSALGSLVAQLPTGMLRDEVVKLQDSLHELGSLALHSGAAVNATTRRRAIDAEKTLERSFAAFSKDVRAAC